MTCANPCENVLMDRALHYLAASVDERYKENQRENQYKAESYFHDIEYIIDHRLFTDEYYVYTDIESPKIISNDSCIHSYYHDRDQELRVVDYNTYVDTWNYYTKNAPLHYTDKTKDYAILADLGFSQWVDLWLDSLAIDGNKLNVDIYNDHNGSMAGGDGAFMVIPVPKGTEIGKINIIKPAHKEAPEYNLFHPLI